MIIEQVLDNVKIVAKASQKNPCNRLDYYENETKRLQAENKIQEFWLEKYEKEIAKLKEENKTLRKAIKILGGNNE